MWIVLIQPDKGLLLPGTAIRWHRCWESHLNLTQFEKPLNYPEVGCHYRSPASSRQKWNLCFVYRLHSACLSFCLLVLFFPASKGPGSTFRLLPAGSISVCINSNLFLRQPGKRESGRKLLEPIGTAHKSSPCRTFIPLYLLIVVCFFLYFPPILSHYTYVHCRCWSSRDRCVRSLVFWALGSRIFFISAKLVQAEV